MVEMPVKDVHLPDIHLPDAITNFEWPKIDLPSIDLGKAVNDAAVAAHIRRPSRARWPFAVVGVLVAGAAWVVLTNKGLRARLASGSRALRAQVSAVRSNGLRAFGGTPSDPLAFPAADTARQESSSIASDAPGNAADYPTGLGSKNGKKNVKSPRAFEGTTSPA
jgi:hypothetical protein